MGFTSCGPSQHASHLPMTGSAQRKPPSKAPNPSGERALQQQRVDPSVVLVADAGQPPGVDEAEAMVQFDRGRIAGVGDHRDDLPEARAAAGVEQRAS